MALVKQFDREKLSDPKAQKPVERATYDIFKFGGAKYLEIRTFGKKDRKKPDHASQILRLSPEAVGQLRIMLDMYDDA